MEFRYRAGDARNPSTEGTAPSRPPHVGGNGLGFHRENSQAVAPRPASVQDELRRQAAKDRIRERILREEVETLALEVEVQRELMEERIPSLRRSTGACACGKGSEAKAAPMAVSSSLEMLIGHEVRSKSNASAAAAAQLPGKRKISCVVAAASTISAAAISEKQKQGLTCMLCGITATGEKGMQDHLKGKPHMSNAAALVQQPPEEAVEHGRLEETEEEGAYTPWKLNIGTNSGMICEVVQMNRYLLCEVCYVKTPDFITMRSHLEGGRHISKAKHQEEQSQAVVAATDASVDPEIETVAVKVNGVRRVDGLLLCEFCDVKTASVIVMRSHLAGKKHASKQKAAGAGGKAVLAEPKTDKDVPVETSTMTPGQQAKKAEAGATVGDANKSVVLDVGGVQHVIEKVDGFLLCACCKVKALSECVMRSHLVGKKHKNKAKVGALDAGAGGKRSVLAEAKSKEAASIVVDDTGRIEGQGNDESVEKPAVENMEAVPSAPPQQDAAAPVCASFSVVPMELDERAEAGDDAAKAEEGKVDAKEEEAVETNGVAAVAGQEVKIQVEGKLFTVLRQADSSLSCGLCALHGCDKDRMLKHLYTREHWHRARISEQNEEQARNVVMSNDSDGVVIPVTDGA